MSTGMIVFNPPAGLPALMSQELLALAGKQDSGGINRISIKGSMFRFEKAGQEVQIMEDRTLDVAIVQISDFTSRSYYAGAYDPEAKSAAPNCSSLDGVTPVVDATSKQSTTCASCPQNISGSKNVSGKAMRACTFKKRIVVVSPNQLQDGAAEVTPFALDVNSISLFDDGKPNEQKFGLNAYRTWLGSYKLFPGAVITRMSFDTDASVPKLFFSVASNSANQAAFLNAEQIKNLIALAKTDEVKKMMNSIGDVAPVGTAPTLPAPITPLVKAKTWQDVARENGADDDDIETLEARVGTPKFAVSWGKIVGDDIEVPSGTPAIVAAPVASPPAPPKVKTWQEIATENGADADDIETIADAGGPTTEKGKKRWDKTVGADVAYGAASAPVVAKGKGKKEKTPDAIPPVAAQAASNPFVTPAAPVAAKAPAQPVSPIPTDVGTALSAKLATFDDE